MPLELLALLVVVGIAGIALILHLTGHSLSDPLTPERASAAWLREFPEAEPEDLRLSDDGRAALVITPIGPGIVWSMGADTAARLLTDPPEVEPDRDGITVRLRDFTAPRIHISLRCKLECRHWTRALTGKQTE